MPNIVAKPLSPRDAVTEALTLVTARSHKKQIVSLQVLLKLVELDDLANDMEF